MGDLLEKKDDFLYYDKEEEKVKLSPQAIELKEVKVLFRRDKSMGKKYFERCIHYCYYFNHKDSPVSHKPVSIKKKDIKVLKDGLLSSFDPDNSYYKSFESVFIKNHFSRLEIRYNRVISDIDELIEHMSMISLYKKIKTEVEVETTECQNGEQVSVKKKVKVDEIVDNSNEKKKAIENIKHLEDLRDMLEKKLRVEYTKKNKGSRRLFDR